MTDCLECFPPIVKTDAKILVLGSFPGELSLLKQQYYAHSRNSFWSIMGELFNFDHTQGYRLNVDKLICNRIALWDVLRQCRRMGSLDTAIRPDSIIVNDFHTLFGRCNSIKTVFFNGSRAEKEFKKHVMPLHESLVDDLTLIRLPSTSPALASLTFAQKLSSWTQTKASLKD